MVNIQKSGLMGYRELFAEIIKAAFNSNKLIHNALVSFSDF